MKATKALILSLLWFHVNAWAAPAELKRAYEVKSGRTKNNVLTRYAREFSTACFHIQILSKDSVDDIKAEKEFCEIEKIAFNSGFADVQVLNISFQGEDVELTISFSPFFSKEEIKACRVKVRNYEIGEFSCDTAQTIWDGDSHATDISDIYKVKSGRIDDVLVRYIEKFYSICFSLQILEPGSWRVLSEREFCDVNGKFFGSDFMDFNFEEVVFTSQGVKIVASVTPKFLAREEIRNCVIPIKDTKIGELSCGDAMDPKNREALLIWP